MSRLLTRFWKVTEVMLIKSLLSRAVPDARVDSVVIVKSLGDQYWFLVAPSHYKYWDRFERTYPHWRQVAYRHGVLSQSVTRGCCPVFPTQKKLLDWISDVLNLTPGERRLLHLVGGKIGCQGR